MTQPTPIAARQFIRTRQAWYANVPGVEHLYVEEEVGLSMVEGGPGGEFFVRWPVVGDEPSAHLEMFADAWHLLPHFSDLLGAMAARRGKNIDVESFCKLCESLGMVDATVRQAPDHLKGLLAQASSRPGPGMR